MLIYGGMVEWWGDDKKGGGVNKRYAPNSTWASIIYQETNTIYQEANTINNAYERRSKLKRVLYDAQMQGGMMTWAWYNYDATIIYLK